MSRPKGSKNKPKLAKAPEANGINGHAPLTEEDFKRIAQKVEEDIVLDAAKNKTEDTQ